MGESENNASLGVEHAADPIKVTLDSLTRGVKEKKLKSTRNPSVTPLIREKYHARNS